MKVKKNKKINILRMLWERKRFYFAGYILGVICLLLNKSLGAPVHIVEMIGLPISVSFIFGYLFYMFKKERNQFIKEGRWLIFSKEGKINLGLSFASTIILGLICKIIEYSFGVVLR